MTFLHRCFSLLMWRLALAAILGAGGYAPAVWAAGTVTDCSTYGPGSGTLAEALAGGGQVNFKCSGTITVPAQIDINNANTTLDASGRTVTLSGNNANRVFYVRSPYTLTLTHLTVSHGKAPFDSSDGYYKGGGIYNAGGTVNLNYSTLSDNSASASATGVYVNINSYGGGIYNAGGTVNLNNSTLWNNSASVSATGDHFNINSYGGGIYNAGGTVNLNNSTLWNNRNNSASVSATSDYVNINSDGGGIYNAGGTVNLNDSTLADNSASATATGSHAWVYASGGGIANGDYGKVTLANSTLSNNSASAGSTYADSYGGGIFNYDYATVTVTNSTLSNNSASADGVFADSYGGGIANWDYGKVTLANSTLSNNSASAGDDLAYSYGGGIANRYDSTATLANSTLSGNRVSATNGDSYGGGIANWADSTVALTNSLIANSLGALNCGGDSSTPVTDNDFNLADDDSCGTIPSTLTGLDPVLADNGGPTWTHALLRRSNAIDTGNCSGGTVTTDQRGVRRPQGSACDIGAYERRWSSSGGGAGVPGISGLGLGGLLVLLPGLALGWRRFSRRPPA